ncbi:unnamed protein product, partial [Rotaria sp. Silwood1]
MSVNKNRDDSKGDSDGDNDSSKCVGQRIDVNTNHFPIKFSKRSNGTVFYQFDVKVEILMLDGSWHSCNRDERLQVLKAIIQQEHFPFVWLTLKFKKEYQCESSHEITGQKNKYQFLIVNLVKTYELQSIFDFIQKRISVRPHDPVRILETLFKQTQISIMITIESQFFPKPQRLDDIGCGAGIVLGFYQGIVLDECGPTLNINNKFGCFYQNYNLVQFITCYLNYNIRKHARDLLISRNTVHYMIAKYKSTKCIGNLIGRGRKRKTTAHLDRVIQRKIKTNRRKSALAVKIELQTELNITVSESTISRRAHEIGLYGRVARKKPLVTKANRGKRVQYARKYREKPLGFWNNVLWSDE